MPQIILWSWELGPDLSVNKARIAYREVLSADPCAYCGEPSEVVDHIEPRGLRGEDAWENLTAACRDCNASKANRTFLGFWLGVPVGAHYGAWLDRIERSRAYMVAERASGRAA